MDVLNVWVRRHCPMINSFSKFIETDILKISHVLLITYITDTSELIFQCRLWIRICHMEAFKWYTSMAHIWISPWSVRFINGRCNNRQVFSQDWVNCLVISSITVHGHSSAKHIILQKMLPLNLSIFGSYFSYFHIEFQIATIFELVFDLCDNFFQNILDWRCVCVTNLRNRIVI